MKKLSEDIQISLSTAPDRISEILEIMIEHVEADFCINVEECQGDNSYWSSTSTLLVEEEGICGTIELGDQQSGFEKIVSLAHEVGHCVLASDSNFGDYKETIFKESLAWYLGYEYFLKQGWTIDLRQYRERTTIALNKYIWSLNERNVKYKKKN